MKNVSHKNNWNLVAVQVYMESHLIMLIKSMNDEKLDRYCVKMKFLRYTSSEKSHLYEFKMEFLITVIWRIFLLIRNFQITLKASGNLSVGAKIQYICTIVRGEVLR